MAIAAGLPAFYTRVSPYDQPLIQGGFHDKDQLAAAWRLFSAQIKNDNTFTTWRTQMVTLNDYFVADKQQMQGYKAARFNLTRNLDSAFNANYAADYLNRINSNDNRRIIFGLTSRINNLSQLYDGISPALVGGICCGDAYNTHPDLHIQFIPYMLSTLGARELITEHPSPNLAGTDAPIHYGKSTSKKKYKKKYY